MSATLGTSALLLGILGTLFGIATNVFIIRSKRQNLIRTANVYASMAVVGALGAFVAMEIALFRNDFSMKYVAEHSARATPGLFKFATLWAALEGSILLWTTILACLVGVVTWHFRKRQTDELVRWAHTAMLGVTAFFFALMLGPANPFKEIVGQIPADGPGPNPLLQNHPLMAFHPPLLYLGYVGFTIPFAFAVAALITGRLGEGWLVETRRWTLLAWGCLSVGILLGSWWSYEVLGWGGFWGWDPVENASLLPWLTGTAFIHSVMVQERRAMLRVWNLSLLCATFSLTILGTFLTRSGVVNSVHAFTAGGVGGWLLGFFGVLVIGSLALIGWRGDALRSPGHVDSPLSREGAFLANNLLFSAFAFVVLLGTTFPLLAEALNNDRLSVGRPYFDRMTMPLALVMLFLMAIAPALPWRKASTELLRDRLQWPAAAAAATMMLCVIFGIRGWAILATFGLAMFAAGAAIRQLILATRRHGMRGLVGRANGGMVVHLGIILIAVAAAASTSFSHRAELRLGVNESAEFAGQIITYRGTSQITEGNKVSTKATVQIGNDDTNTFAPALQSFANSQSTISVPSVQTGVFRDVYLTFVQPQRASDNTAVIGVIVQPMQVWMWIGGGFVAIGSLLAAFPGKRRKATDSSTIVLTDSTEANVVWRARSNEPTTRLEGTHK